MPSLRTCSLCNIELPLTASYFDRKRDAPDGFRSECKQCRKEKREKGNRDDGQLIDPNDDDASAKAMRRLKRSLMNAPANESRLPHQAEIYERLMDLAGGASGFAELYMASVLAAPVGSINRQKGLDAILRLGIKVSEDGQANQRIEDMSQEDIERELGRLLAHRRLEQVSAATPRLTENAEDDDADDS